MSKRIKRQGIVLHCGDLTSHLNRIKWALQLSFGVRYSRCDVIALTGGLKFIASDERLLGFIEGLVKKYIELHGENTIFIVLDTPCGAYGGVDSEVARKAQMSDAKRVSQVLEKLAKVIILATY